MRARHRVRLLVAMLAALLAVPALPAGVVLAAPEATTTTVSSSASPSSTYGEGVTFTATVGAAVGTPTGTVQFKVDGVDLSGPVTLVAAAATSVVTSALTVGNHEVTADYFSNDPGNFLDSTGTLSDGQTVDRAELTVTPDAKSVAYGSSVPAYTFGVSGFVLGQSEGTAAGYSDPACASPYTITTPVSGSPLTITCSGGSATNYRFAYLTAQLTIDKANQTINFTSTAPSGATVDGPPYTPTATAASGDPVTFTIDGAPSSVCTISAGVVSFAGTGTCTIDANQAGNANWNAAPQVQQAVVVGQATTTTAVVSSANPVTYGTAITLTATVSPAAATGTVTFKNGATTLGTCTLTAGTCGYATGLRTLDASTHSLTAEYGGSGSYSGSVSTALSQVVNPKPLSISGVTADNKIYDGTMAATLTTGSAALIGVVPGDAVTLGTAGATGTFASKNVGNGKAVATAGFTIGGADAANYGLTQPSTTANITALSLTATASGIDKVYDGTTATTVALASDKIVTDAVTVGYTSASFATKNVGAGKTVSVFGISITGGADAGNYSLANTTATTTANITVQTLTATATGVNKQYDGTTAATVTLAGTTVLTDVVTLGYAIASFTTAAVGVGKTVNVSGISITGGADAGNYVLDNTTASTTASITTASVTPSATAPDKVYDGTTAAPGTTCSLAGVFPADVGNVTCSGTASFADKNAGTNKTVTLTEITLGGSAAGYYALSATTATDQANITPRPLTVTATGVTKVYDGSAVATVTLGDDRIADDSLVLAYAGASFDNPNAGNSKPVTVVGISVAGGAAAGNYTLANTTAAATAVISAVSTAASVGTSVNPVPVTTPVTLTARVTWPGGAPSGSVVFRDGPTPIGGPVALANGTATLITSFAAAGTRDITAAYVPDTANFAASTSAVFTQTVGRSSVRLDLAADRATWETGVPFTLTARLRPAATGVTVALTGSVAFRIDGALVATVPVAGGAAAHQATLAAGSHAIVATFVPDAAAAIAFDGSESAPLVGSVVANAVAASGIGLSSSTVYPYRDTWRDTVTIGGSRTEPLSVTIRIYRPSGSLLTTRTIAAGSGAYASAWNGRTSGGTILPAGRYRIVQTLTDPSSVPPLVRSWISYVTLSTRRMAWTTVSLYRNANAPARWSGAPSRLSSSRYRSGARLITPSSMPGGWAAFGYQFTLPSATTIRSVAFFVQGGPWSGPTAPKIGLHDWRAGGDWAAMYDGARTRRPVGTSTSSWYGIAGDPAVVVKSISGRRYVRAFVDTGGYVAGFRYELGRVRLVVTYGVLK